MTEHRKMREICSRKEWEMSVWFIYIVFAVIASLVSLAATAAMLIGQGAVFRKAGKAFWRTFVPFYNQWTLYEITWGHGAYMFLEWIPFAGAVFSILTSVKLGRAFRKSGGFIVGLVLLAPVFEIILGYDDSEYYGIEQW